MYSDIANPGMFGPNIGVWKIMLDPQPASGPTSITISCNTTEGASQKIQLKDVLFGDVWVCSGQSNMQFPVKKAYNATAELKASSQYTNVRVMTISRDNTATPLYDIRNITLPWSLPSPSSLGGTDYFSAVCWFFGRDLYDAYGVPIGLVESAWGGTRIQVWSPPDVIDKCGDAAKTSKQMVNQTTEEAAHDLMGLKTPKPPTASSQLWNAMIHPLLNMTIKGAIWYQGEQNTGRPDSYKCLFPNMIASWRDKWHAGSNGQTNPVFPFGFVQLCTSTRPEISNIGGFPVLRWHQTTDYGYAPNPAMPNVFMATALDLPDLQSTISPVHPRDKQDVGLRLSLAARGIAYGEESLVYQGPFPTKITVDESQLTILVMYDNISSDHIKLVGASGFEVCCSFQDTCQANDVWLPLPVISLTNIYAITLSYDCLMAKPVALRYLWRDYPCTFKDCTVYTEKNNLPALPFVLPLN
ncbi:sialate O-acetylesterase-like isoform X3 [Amphiura filiformis]|uniref:sialate O-acetylesterase-like isoform X3 n=1 Tax=Amphiura filiformis TaxID=82378 RepID=UPI003B217E5D